jgi:hypothetical protein
MVQTAQQVVADLPPFATMAQMVVYSRGSIDSSDPTAELMLDAVSNLIRRHCGWHIYPSVEFDLVMDGPGGVTLQLPSKYVTDVASITENGTLTDPTVYAWSQLGEVQRSQAYWNNGVWFGWWVTGFRSIEAVFTSGYDEAPPELAVMVMSLTARALSSPAGVTREAAGGVSVQYALSSTHTGGGLALMENDLATLDAYRIVGA